MLAFSVEHTLVSGALLVAVTVPSAAGVGAAAMPPPPFPGARAGAAPVSRRGARASPSAVTRTRPVGPGGIRRQDHFITIISRISILLT